MGIIKYFEGFFGSLISCRGMETILISQELGDERGLINSEKLLPEIAGNRGNPKPLSRRTYNPFKRNYDSDIS